MERIEKEDDKRLASWFRNQYAKINTVFKGKSNKSEFSKIFELSILKIAYNITMKQYLVLFGVACSISEKILQKNIDQIINAAQDKGTMENPFGAVNDIIKGLDG